MIQFAYIGLLRKSELIPGLKAENVVVKEGRVEVTIAVSKHRKKPFTFYLMSDEDESVDPVRLVQRYLRLRKPKDSDRFFLNYNHMSGCYIQNMGDRILTTLPRTMATKLGCQKPADYTWHCYRRSGATQLLESGLSIENIQRAGRWRSPTAAAEYFEETSLFKTTTANALQSKKVHHSQLHQPHLPLLAVTPSYPSQPISVAPAVAGTQFTFNITIPAFTFSQSQ